MPTVTVKEPSDPQPAAPINTNPPPPEPISNEEQKTTEHPHVQIGGVREGVTRASEHPGASNAFQLSRRVIPGNAGAKMTTTEATTAASGILASTAGTSHHIPMETVDPGQLQMDIEKQTYQLNRLAMLRQSMRAQSQVFNARSTMIQSKKSHFEATARPTGASIPEIGEENFPRPSKKTLTPSKEEVVRKKSKRMATEWKKLTSVKANNDLYDVTKYRSKHSGMTLVHAKVESPEVFGYLVFRHKCDNHWGLPHILQHMIFLGSKEIPFQGVLDQLAVKCFSPGTDAWTDSDHACYTLKTAGKEGFLSLLPIYLEHVFYPTLGEAGYITEVHHVTGEGRDGGLCYMEMMSNQHDPLEAANWALMSEIYGKDSGYHYNYGGHCKEMRDSCTLAAVRNFHTQYYHPKNFCLIVCGDLEPEEVFGVITPYIMSLGEDAGPPDFENPWKTEGIIEIEEEIETERQYPAESEGLSLVKVALVNPTSAKDVTLSTGIDILMQYLVYSPISPIHKEFVQENALASHVHLTEFHHFQTIYCLNFENVETTSKTEIPSRLRQLLEKQYTSDFDPERMEHVIAHVLQVTLSSMENEAENTIARAVISDFIYDFDDDPLLFDRRINHSYTLEQFQELPPSFWLKLLKMLIDSNWATVYTDPSTSAGILLREEEEARLTELHDKMGESGRKKVGIRLQAALKIQSKIPPPELFHLVETPSIGSIGFLGIERHSNPSWAGDTLCNLYLDDINSSYVYLTVLMDTSELTLEEKKYLVLFSEAILEAPYVDNTQRFYSYDQMVAGLSRDVLNYETFFGIDWDKRQGGTRFSCGNYSHLFCIRFQMELKKVKEGFEWMQMLLWNTKWQPDRLKIIAQRLANEVHTLMDHGSTMAHAMTAESLYHMDSNVKAMSLVRQKVLLEKIAKDLPKSFKKVAKQLEAIRMVILRPENTTVHVATRLARMDFYLTDKPEIRDAIAQLLRRTFDYTGWHWGYPTKRLANDPDHKWMMSVRCIKKCVTEKILRMHSADEGTSLIQVIPCIQNFQSPLFPIILTAIHYFCQHEGPFFRAIKGPGLAHHYAMTLKPEEGMLYFEIKGATDLVSAYVKAFEIIANHLKTAEKEEKKEEEEDDIVEEKKEEEDEEEEDEEEEEEEEEIPQSKPSTIINEDIPPPTWSQDLLTSAKSSAIFELIEKENTPRSLALNSLLDHYRRTPKNFNRQVMQRICDVTLEEVMSITKLYFRPLFINTSSCSVAAPSDLVPSIIKGLMDNCGKRLSLLPPVHQSEMSNFL